MIRVLVVEDDARLRRALTINFEARGYRAVGAPTGEDALALARDEPPDLVVLDLGLPGISGLQVLASLRAWCDAPVVVLSARDTEPDKIRALDTGADDYLTKPFGIEELLARVRAALRRHQPTPPINHVATAHFTLDLANRTCTVAASGHDDAAAAVTVHLTPTEWTLVEHLCRHPDQLVTSRQLVQRMWGAAGGDDTAALRVHLGHLRRKLEPDPAQPRYFVTDPGIGYRFVPDRAG